MVTALKEVQALISIPSGPAFTIVTVPWVTVAIQGFLSSVLDLTQSANVEAVGSSYQELTGAWRWVPGQTGEPPTHLPDACATRPDGLTGFRILRARILLLAFASLSFRIACGSRPTLKCTILTAMWRRGCRSDARVKSGSW